MTTLSFAFIVAPDARCCSCVADVVLLLIVYVYDDAPVLQITMLETTVYDPAVVPLS